MATTPRIVLNGLDLSEPQWGFDHTALDGLGSPGSTIDPQQRVRAHGAIAGRAYLRARHVTLAGTMTASSEADLWALRDLLASAVALDDHALVLHEQGRSRSLTVRREDEVLVRPLTDHAARWSVQLVALDPRLYGAALSASTALPSSSGGLVVPITVPIVIEQVQESGRVVLTNPGNIASPVRLRIDGPSSGVLVGPRVTHVESGSVLDLGGARLGPGDWVTVADRQVLEQGVAPRAGWVTARGWFDLLPGVNTVAWEARESGPGSLLTVESWEAWA